MASISRRTARESAVKALYSYEFNAQMQMEASEFFALICTEAEIPSNEFATSLFCGTIANLAAIDEKIIEYAKGWKKERIARMSLAILRLCTYELLYSDVPRAVALNEAIEIAKTYDTDDAPAFINGILNAIAKEAGNKA